MLDGWAALPVAAQDAALTLGLLVPGLLVGALAVRGFAPGALVAALLWRVRGAGAVFVGLIAVAVALGAGLTAQERALRRGSARAAEPFPLVLGAPGSEVSLVLAAVYLRPADMPLLTGAQWAEVAADPDVDLAAPIAFGDSFGGAPVVGTTAAFVDHLGGALAEGRAFRARWEAVAGAFAPVGVGERFTPAHGVGAAAEDHAHGAVEFAVVGRMAPTGSPWDRAILVPVEAVWEVHALPSGHAEEGGGGLDGGARADERAGEEHADGHAGGHADGHGGEARIGPPFDPDHFPGTPAILVRAGEVWANYALKDRYTRADMMAVFPGATLAGLHGLMREVREAMTLMALVTQGLVAAAVLAGLLLVTRLLARPLALLRALGAPRRFVLAVVWGLSAALLGAGALLGLAGGWLAAAVLSRVVTARTDVLVAARPGWAEAQAVAAFVSLALLLALLPALAASRRPLLPDLRAS